MGVVRFGWRVVLSAGILWPGRGALPLAGLQRQPGGARRCLLLPVGGVSWLAVADLGVCGHLSPLREAPGTSWPEYQARNTAIRARGLPGRTPHLAQMGVCKSSNPLRISHIAWFVTTRCGANPPEFGPILALSPGPIFILSFGPISGSILGLSPSLHLGPFLEPRVSQAKSRPSPRCDSAGSECFAPQRPVPWPVNVLVRAVRITSLRPWPGCE